MTTRWRVRQGDLPWFRCEDPERPPDPLVRWHYDDCYGCLFGASILLAEYPDDPHVCWLAHRMGADQ